MEEENTIVLEAKGHLRDEAARELLKMFETRIDTINERTKSHTLEIRSLKRRIKELEKK